MATEMVKGKTIQEALELTNRAVIEALDGLPPAKVHCSVLAEEAVKSAIADYLRKQWAGPFPRRCRRATASATPAQSITDGAGSRRAGSPAAWTARRPCWLKEQGHQVTGRILCDAQPRRTLNCGMRKPSPTRWACPCCGWTCAQSLRISCYITFSASTPPGARPIPASSATLRQIRGPVRLRGPLRDRARRHRALRRDKEAL